MFTNDVTWVYLCFGLLRLWVSVCLEVKELYIYYTLQLR